MATPIVVFFDYTCPFCYLSSFQFERLKSEFDNVEVEWHGLEIHPEIPPEGVPRKPLEPGSSKDERTSYIQQAAQEAGVEYRQAPFKASSRLALHASEYAKDAGLFDEFHRLVFKAYFQDSRNIGQMDTVLELAGEAGLDTDQLADALHGQWYEERLDLHRFEAKQMHVKSVPSVFIANRLRLDGADRYEALKEALLKVHK